MKIERLEAFSDGVLAIAITLLVLGLEVPSVHKVPEKELAAYLLDSLHPMMGFAMSFLFIGMYWLQHYAVFHFLTHANRTLAILNGAFLFFVSFLPFPTGLCAVYRTDVLAVVLYASVNILCGLSLLAIWRYATAGFRLVPPELPHQVVRSMFRRMAMGPVVSLVAIALAPLNIWLSRILLFAIPLFHFSHRVVDAANLETMEEVSL